ncbi:MAG: sugar phosphate isomerase/epimerase [Planctomyces sp.]|nr:sugar phosphate isomerase/epimerase [Planctomyces sp.]
MRLTRRQFLPVALSACARPWRPIRAADPIARTGRPHFKLALAAYSFHSRLPKNWPRAGERAGTMSLEDVIDFCAAQDLDGVELTSYYFPAEVTPPYLAALKEQTFRLGLDISGTAIGNDFCLPDGPERDAQLALTRQWIDYAAAMGAPVIRIFAGQTPRGDSESQAVERCVAGIEASLEHAAEKGVALALENHGGITATADQLLRIVRAVQPSPWFGVNFDSGNFHSADPYAELEHIAPYALNAQLKASIAPEGRKAAADLGRIVEILKAAGYRGYLVLEYEEPDDPFETIPGLLATLKSLIGRGAS